MAKSVKKSSNSRLHQLYDIFFMILVRLPTSFLLQMKLVCSQWRSMISDPVFIKAHLDALKNDKSNNHLTRYLYGPPMRSSGLEDVSSRSEHTIPVTRFSNRAEILGSCNGLILIGDDDRTYYLWNPSTRLLRKFDGPYLFRAEFRNFGFGYDSSSCAYKVVRIVRVSSRKVGLSPPSYNAYCCYDSTTAKVYNCKTDRWKKVEDFPYVIFENARGLVLNGVPHWVMFRDYHGEDDAIDLVIVCFDFAEEKFKEIPTPNWLVHSSVFEFGVFDGRLCFIHITQRKYKVWVMKKYGEDSWIDITSEVDINSLCITQRQSSDTVTYHRGLEVFNGVSYMETLVSPYGGSDMIG